MADMNKSTLQKWLLSIAVDAETVPTNSNQKATPLSTIKMKLVLTWDKKTNEFAIAREEASKDQPREPADKTETAILEWLRRIHFKARTAFQTPYPGLVSRYPEGDVFGYIIVTTIDGMERAFQETAFNDYAELRRLFIVFVASNDRESTAALRTMPGRTLPSRTSIVVGT